MTFDTTLPACDPFRFNKKSFAWIIKITVADQIKVLDRKIKQNQTQYNLDKKPSALASAKTSALSSGILDKYQYVTGEDLNYKPCTADQAKFDYSQLNIFFTKGLKKGDKKEGLLKRLKNTDDKSEEQLKAIYNKTDSIKAVTNFVE